MTVRLVIETGGVEAVPTELKPVSLGWAVRSITTL
jgi:hypothetical protein